LRWFDRDWMRATHGIGGAVSSHILTPAEDTAAILQEAARAGSAMMIPGALESRAGRTGTPPPNVPVAAPHAPAVVMGDRQRLEYEREGGGAPSERASGRHSTRLARLWHWALYQK
jgi:hypothetical protein